MVCELAIRIGGALTYFRPGGRSTIFRFWRCRVVMLPPKGASAIVSQPPTLGTGPQPVMVLCGVATYRKSVFTTAHIPARRRNASCGAPSRWHSCANRMRAHRVRQTMCEQFRPDRQTGPAQSARMKYFFHLEDGACIRDPKGDEFPNDAAAMHEAARVAQELSKLRVHAFEWRVVVKNADGLHVGSVPLVPDPTAYAEGVSVPPASIH